MAFKINLTGIPGRRHLARRIGQSQRLCWRPRYRLGERWHAMSAAQTAREMRMVSHRRAI